MGGLLRASLPLVALIVLFSGNPLHAQAQNARATTFPAEDSQVLATKGDVTYWFEQARDYGTKAVGTSALGGSTAKRPQFVLDLSNGRLVCTLAALATREKIEENDFSAPLNDCAFTYSDTGHVRVLTPNLISGARDILYDGSGPDAKVIRGADGGIAGDKDENGDPVMEQGEPGKCGITDVLCALGKLPGILVSGIAYLLLVLSTMILFVAGTVFNWVVIRTVFQFGLYFGTSEGMLIAWGVLRDIANIALLFGFIFMGIATILNTPNMEGYSAKKALPRLIIFAVLLNFSLFATQGIIDVANGFAAIFNSYAGEQTCDETTSNSGGQSTEGCASVGISGKIMAAAGMSHFPTLGEAGAGLQGMLDRPYTTATMLVVLSVLVTITAVVLFAAAIMLVVRVVVLSLLMVTSPIGFAGMAIPSLQGLAKDWWHQLINQSFFAPLYLLMVFISLKLVDGLQSGGATIPDAILGNVKGGGTVAGNMQVLVVYAVVIGFMIASLMIAKKMGAAGAGFATNAASAVVYGSLARGMNITMGGATRGLLATSRLAQKGVTRFAPNSTGLNNFAQGANRAANMLHRTTANANLDARRIPGMGAVLGMGGITAGAKAAEHASYTDITHIATEAKEGKLIKGLVDQADKDERTHRLNQIHGDDIDEEQQRDLALITEEKELAALHGIKTGVTGLARALSSDQFKKLMEGKELSNGEKEKLRNARLGMIKEQMTRIEKGKSSTATAEEKEDAKKAKQELRSMSGYDLGQLGRSSEHGDLLGNENFATLISDDQADGLQKNDNLTVTQKQSAKNARKARFNATNAQATIDGMSREQINKLDQDTVTDDNVLPHIKPDHLVAMMDDNRYDATQKGKMQNELNRRFDATNATTTLSAMTPDQRAKLPGNILTQPHVISQLSISDFEKIRGAKSLTFEEQAEVGRELLRRVDNTPEGALVVAYVNSDPRISSYWRTS